MSFPDTVPGVLRDAARRYGDAPAIEDGDCRWSFIELAGEVDRAAAAFLSKGLNHGDGVAIWAPNRADWIVAAIGAQAAGAAIVPLNTRLKGAEAGDILRRSRARLLVTTGRFLDTNYPALLAGQDLPDLEQIITLDGEHGGCTAWESFLPEDFDQAAVDAGFDAVTGEDLSDIIYTSGTTGAPKGVMCSHAQTVRAFVSWSELAGIREGDRYLVINPFFHTFGYKAGWLACLVRGATILPMAVFDASQALRRIAADRVTVLPGPPALFQAMLADPALNDHDLSTLRVSVTGAANVPPVLIQQMREELGIDRVMTGYGLTESTGVVTMCRPDDDAKTVARTCGAPIPDVEICCADDEGKTVPAGEPGEVLVRGFNVMQGYLDDPNATAEAVDSGGWLHTGDIGVIDERGYLAITDRKKDLFIMGGFNCYPAEIEHLMSAHPDVTMVAVIGVPDERMGEVGKAFVVRKPGSELTKAELSAWCREHMANFKVPRHFEFRDALPMTASGKVQRFALRDG